MNLNSTDHEYNNLQVTKVLAVPGRAVIQDLYVKNLYTPVVNNLDFATSTTVASPSPAPAPPQYQLLVTNNNHTISDSFIRYAALDVTTLCSIPLAMAGTGSWLNLQECAKFQIDCQSNESPLVTVSPHDNYLCFVDEGIYKIELNLKIGHTGHGMHSISVGLGINETPPKRAMASCLSFGGAGDLCGTAVGTAVLKIETLPACVDIFLRDDTIPATDANIFHGSLFLTYLGPIKK